MLGTSTPPPTAAQILAMLLLVDGQLSTLDADYLRGLTADGLPPNSPFGAMPRAGQVPRVLRSPLAIPAYQ